MNENPHILKELFEQQSNLIKRLKATRDAITGFGGEISNDELEVLLCPEEDLSKLRSNMKIPEHYSNDLQMIEKIAYIITNDLKGEGSTSDIAEKLWIRENTPEDRREIDKRRVAIMASYLYRDGRLRVTKIGNKHIYKLNNH
jgi:hypothetical protein